MTISFERRLATFQAARAGSPPPPPGGLARASSAAAERLAAEVDGELVRTPAGSFVRLEGRGEVVPVDRERLARLPGQPPPDVPLVCLDTETTGLATAAGTIAFLVGLGWWQGSRFRQLQLLLPDHAFEPALLDELRSHVPAGAWLVTYNGRTFDWPLLVTRYRMARRDAPVHAGHLDLLPFVRRVFRHRLPDARLRTVETALLGVRRDGDVEGWEIPGRYFDFLRGGPVSPLREVIVHNDTDVRSLALLVAMVERRLGDPAARAGAPPGDLAGLARAYARERRLPEALDCLEAAMCAEPAGQAARDPFGRTPVPVRPDPDDLGWTSSRRRADFGGAPLPRNASPWPALARVMAGQPWTGDRIAVDHARLLRRIGRHADAEAAWSALAQRGGRTGLHAWLEVAKLREHRLANPSGALDATLAAARLLHRNVPTAGGSARLERDVAQRAVRLRKRLSPTSGRGPASGSALGNADALLRKPDRVGDPLGARRGAPGALDPPQERAPGGRAERLESRRGGRIGTERLRQVGRDDQRVDLVERAPRPIPASRLDGPAAGLGQPAFPLEPFHALLVGPGPGAARPARGEVLAKQGGVMGDRPAVDPPEAERLLDGLVVGDRPDGAAPTRQEEQDAPRGTVVRREPGAPGLAVGGGHHCKLVEGGHQAAAHNPAG